MASSFHLFRRNQKLMLAILTLLAMFAFVFLDPMMKYLGNNQAPPNPVLVESKYGELKRSDIDNLIADRRLVDNFITMIVAATVDKFIDQGRFDARSRETYIKLFADEWRRRLLQRAGSTEEAAAVETMLLDKRAEQIGLIVSDAAVNQVLREISADTLSSRDVAGLISRLRYGQTSVGEQQLFAALKKELAAWRMTQLFSASVDAIPPAQRFDYFNRLHRKAKIEAIAVNVEDFVDKVSDPPEADLIAFFDKHKNQLAFPGSPEPGFKQPHRERFQYFKAEYDIFRELAEVTDEEIEKYYEENKKTMFRKLALPADEPKAEKKEGATKGEDPEPETGEPAAEPKSTEEKPAEGTTEPAKEEIKPTDETTPDAPAKPAEPTAPESPKPEGNVKSGAAQSVFRLVADEKPAEPAADEPAATPGTPAAAEGEAKPAVEEKPADPAPADKPAEEPAAEKPATDKPATGEPEYEPLDKVREDIVTALKSQKAGEKINAAINDLSGRMRAFADARTLYLLKKETDPSAKPPKELDFVALAKEHNVSFEETKLASAYEINSTALGKSSMRVRGELPFQFRDASFIQVAFGPSRPMYTSVTTNDVDGNAFLSWKVEQSEEKVPTFEEAKANVLHAWKLIKARDLAKKQAEAFAAEANGAKKNLSEVFTGEKGPKVVLAGPFSWVTMGSTPDEARGGVVMLSEVPGLENVGNSFMERVFSLSKGEAGVAANEPKDIFYTVQVTEFDPPVATLEEDFASEDFRRYMNVAMGDTRQIYQSWVDSLGKQADLKWLNQPEPETVE